MAIILNVTGPHKLTWGTSTASTDLGRTDNDDLINVELETKYFDIHTNEYGQGIADAIQMGAQAFLNFTMVAYDPAQVASLWATFTGVANPQSTLHFPDVGRLLYNGGVSSRLVTIAATSATSGPTYTFSRLRPLTHTLKDVGNKPTRAAFRFEIIPGSATNNSIYAVS